MDAEDLRKRILRELRNIAGWRVPACLFFSGDDRLFPKSLARFVGSRLIRQQTERPEHIPKVLRTLFGLVLGRSRQ